MSNPFLLSTAKLIKQHGESVTYTQVTEGSYNIETGSTANTSSDHIVTMYKKHLKANQYNFPNLVGITSAIFYLANSGLTFTPAIRDKITVNGEMFEINTIVEHRARGELVLYKLVAVKG